jgi:hypothetical protein
MNCEIVPALTNWQAVTIVTIALIVHAVWRAVMRVEP